MAEWQHVELNPEGSHEWSFEIPYAWRTKEYGRAEFSFCLKWKRGKITDLWISAHQQIGENQGKMWHLRVHGSTSFNISPSEAHLWLVGWCPLHKTQNYSMYVADDTDTLAINLLSSISIMCVKSRKAAVNG